MKLDYTHKRSEKEIFDSIPDIELEKVNISTNPNLLIHSDNLIALKQLITKHNLEGKIDLIYIDPPFATNNTFTVSKGRANTISNSSNGTLAYKDYL